MDDCLTRLGVPSNIRDFFAVKEPFFDFGNEREYFNDGIHRVPVTNNLWIAGNPLARQVIMTFSAMEAIAFLTLNQSDYQEPDDILFVATGAKINSGQLKWMRVNLKRRHLILVFGNDLIGRLTDIKVATGIKNKQVRLFFQDGNVIARLKEKKVVFQEDKLSLSAFESAFAIRTEIRTCKPHHQLTFLDQLKYDTSK